MKALFYIAFQPPNYPSPDQDTVDFWDTWDETKEYLISTMRDRQRLVVILPASLEEGTGLVLDVLRTEWAKTHKAELLGTEILEALLHRVRELSAAAEEATGRLKRTRSAKHKLWHRDIAAARKLLEEVLAK